MTIDQIFKLLDAGFTKEEIKALTGSVSAETAGSPTNAPESTEADGGTITPPEAENAAQGENSAPQGTQTTDAQQTFNETVLNAINALNDSVKALSKTQQTSNVRGLSFTGSEREDAATVLARIIDPTFKRQ